MHVFNSNMINADIRKKSSNHSLQFVCDEFVTVFAGTTKVSKYNINVFHFITAKSGARRNKHLPCMR